MLVAAQGLLYPPGTSCLMSGHEVGHWDLSLVQEATCLGGLQTKF